MEVLHVGHQRFEELGLCCCGVDPVLEIVIFVVLDPSSLCFLHLLFLALVDPLTELPLKLFFHSVTPYPGFSAPCWISAVVTIQIPVFKILFNIFSRTRLPCVRVRRLGSPRLAFVPSYCLVLLSLIISAYPRFGTGFFFIEFLYIIRHSLFCLERVRVGKHESSANQVDKNTSIQQELDRSLRDDPVLRLGDLVEIEDETLVH